jgi:hypothetical protein
MKYPKCPGYKKKSLIVSITGKSESTEAIVKGIKG